METNIPKNTDDLFFEQKNVSDPKIQKIIVASRRMRDARTAVNRNIKEMSEIFRNKVSEEKMEEWRFKGEDAIDEQIIASKELYEALDEFDGTHVVEELKKEFGDDIFDVEEY
jgi:hypothetical protein